LLRLETLAYHQDVTFGKGPLEGGAGFNVNRLGEIESSDFGASTIGQRRDGEGDHGLTLPTSCVVIRLDSLVCPLLALKLACRRGARPPRPFAHKLLPSGAQQQSVLNRSVGVNLAIWQFVHFGATQYG
jgi:hypothetical protein